MGYMGLSCVEESDLASDLAWSATQSMAKVLTKGLKEKSGQFNTNGPVNVALFFEQFLLPIAALLWNHDHFTTLATETVAALRKYVKVSQKAEWENSGNKNMHLRAYRRMLKNLTKYLNIIAKEQP